MKLPTTAPALLLIAGLSGCSTAIQLTDGGHAVQHVTRDAMPTSCNLLGDVAIGIPPDAARPETEEELVILMRNKAAELGGSHVVLDHSESRTDSNGEPYYRGRGIAYACPPPPPPEASAGGEDAEGTAGGDDAETEETEGAEDPEGASGAAEDDEITRDLLGE